MLFRTTRSVDFAIMITGCEAMAVSCGMRAQFCPTMPVYLTAIWTLRQSSLAVFWRSRSRPAAAGAGTDFAWVSAFDAASMAIPAVAMQ